MTPETLESYGKRCTTELGQGAHAPEQVLAWCYNHPPKKPLPKSSGARDRHVYISHRTLNVLAAVAGYANADGLAEAILLLWIKENVPDISAMFDRHTDELAARIAELRHNEPELRPQSQHCSSDIGDAE